jgi:acetyltransferase-like isoleucine patch superfamily enzyme
MNRKRPDRPIPRILQPLRSTVRSWRCAKYRLLLGRRLTLGSGVQFGADAVLLPPEHLRIGNNVAIGRSFHLEANLFVGPDVLISSRVAIIGNDHLFDTKEETVFWAGRNSPSTVYLEGDNLIGFGTTIIGSVRVGRGTIVGARSVVTTDLPPNTVCVGVPARPIRERSPGESIRASARGGGEL